MSIGSILAQSGAASGANIGAGMSGLGGDIRGMLTGVGQGISRRRMEGEAQKLLEAHKDNPAALMEAARKFSMQGNKQMADMFQQAAQAAQANINKKTGEAQGRGKGELMALANDPAFDLNSQKMRSGYIGMADSFGVPRDEAMRIALDARDKEKETNTDYRKGGEVTIRDEKGNTFLQYTIQDINNPSAEPEVKTISIGNSPAEPVGNTTIVSGTTGAGAFDKPGISGDVRQAQKFSELQVQAANNLPDLQSEARILDDAVAALETMPSQGLPEVIEDKIRREFGIQDPDIAEYELLVGELMFSRLKPLFGGVISEGEREAIMKLYNNLKRGNPANKRILMQLQKKIKESIVKANLIRKSDSFAEYNASLDRLYPSDGEQPEENVIDFSQLP